MDNAQNDTQAVIRLDDTWAEELAELEAACFSTPWDADDFRKVINQPYYSVFGILRQGRLAAYISLAHGFGDMEILNIATREDCRRQGLGRDLLNHVLGLMQDLTAETVFLEVRERNSAARALYRQFDFEQTGRRKAYYGDTGEDALVLSRRKPWP